MADQEFSKKVYGDCCQWLKQNVKFLSIFNVIGGSVWLMCAFNLKDGAIHMLPQIWGGGGRE